MLSQSSTKSLVFIDAAVDDYQSLLNGVIAETDVIVLDLQRDGVLQITEALRDRPTPAAIHIVSHGSPGALYLGNSQLNLRNLAHYADDLAGWSAPQLLLYGCNVAAGDAGEEFIAKLHHLTGAEIAASTTPIGNAALGGDWNLDVQTGEMEMALAILPAMQRAYSAILNLSVTQDGNATSLLNKILGTTTGLSNITASVTGDPQSFGQFSTDPFGLGSGIVLSTGKAVSTVGPNNSAGVSDGLGLTSATLTIQFDADSTVNSIYFNYVFGSEEFPEYVGSFNDAFQLSINGTNLAKLTNGSDVTINNLFPTTDYVDGAGNADTQLDGFSKVLTLTGTLIKNGQNTIVIHINDVGDASYDSAVFIQGGSLGTSPPVVDTTPPTAPATAPDLDAASDLGASSTDNLTSDTTPTFVGAPGSGVFGDTITLYEGSTVLGTGTIAADGSWSVTASVLGNGVHNISATFRDVAGNESAQSSALPVTISSTAPAAPASAPDLETASDTGVSSTDDLTNVTTPTFVGAPGSGTAGDIVTLYDGATVVGTGTVAVDGSWTVATSVLSDGLYNISASFTDAVGSESAKSAALPVTINNAAPTAPTSAPDLIPASDTGASNTDNVTTDTTPTFVGAPGSGTPGQLVTLYDSTFIATPIGTGIVAADGSWSITASTLGGGVNTIAFTLTDAVGNESAFSPDLSITIEGAAPAAPSTSQLDPITDSGVSNSDNLTNDKTPTFKGTNQPGNTVELFAGTVSLGRAIVDSTGKWSLTPTTVLADGNYQITLKAIGPSGLVSASSAAVPLTIDTRPATAAILEIDQPVRDSGANTLTVRFSEAVRNVDPSDLALSLNGQPIPLVGATLTTTDNISWTLGNIPGLTQASGDYQISLKPSNDITDSAGNALATGNTESWLTGYTSDAMPSFGFKDGKKGIKIRDGRDSDILWGRGGRDTLSGSGGNDRLSGRGGSDKIKGGAGKDRMGGGTSNDQLFGGGGADRLKGKKGQDRLIGGGGNDRLIGGGGDDVLVGGQGRDVLTGGNGKDSFTFNNLSEAGDRVTDFDSANDLLDVRGIFAASKFGGDNRFAQYHQFMQLVQVGSDTEVRVDTDGKGAGTAFTTLVTLQNVLVSGVQSTNFVVG